MQTHGTARIRREAKRLPETAQICLFPIAEAKEVQRPEGPAGLLNPPPERLFVGDQPLSEYLPQHELGWVLELRRWLFESDLSGLTKIYRPNGRPAIHPGILLGLILYGCLESKSSLRNLEMLSKRDVGAWWLCGGLQPDHSTIGKFLQLHDKVLTDEYFISLTRMLLRRLHLSAGEAAGDGTVIEAAASHYRTLRAEAAREAAEEARREAAARSGDVAAQVEAVRAAAVAAVATEREAKQLRAGKDPEAIAVSPSEPEALVQPLKNGARRPSYKPSVLANRQRLIVGQHVLPGDEVGAVEPMLQQHQAITGALPSRLLQDAGYHNHKILALSVALNLDLLCPSGKTQNGEWTKQSRQGKLHKNQFRYDEPRDVYLCSAGQELHYIDQGQDRDGRHYRRFQCRDHGQCPFRAQCTKSAKLGRTVKRYEGDELKEAMALVMQDERARRAYGWRKAMVEPVFAELRERQGLRRFHRRGLRGARLEFALHCLAYNLKRGMSLAGGGLIILLLARLDGGPWRCVLACGLFSLPLGRK